MRQEVQDNKMTELTDDARLLVISHIPMAYAMAWRMKDSGVCLDDLRQEACIGLCEAAMRYNEAMECRFATYAAHWCRKMMLMAIHGTRDTGSLEEKTFREQEDDENRVHTAQQRRIDDALQCLTQPERQIITQFYGIGTERQSLTEIAASLGLSNARASIIHHRALKKLKATLTEHPIEDYLTPWLE